MRHPDERSADARPGAGGPGGSAHADEGTIHAWLDDALPPAEAEALERHVAGCAECRARVAEARGLVAASSRILSALDDVPGGVLPGSQPAGRERPAAALPAAAAAMTVGAAAAAPPSVTAVPAPGAAAGDDAVRPLRPAAPSRGGAWWRGWRAQAAAAVALLAVGTTAVLQRGAGGREAAYSAADSAVLQAESQPGGGPQAPEPVVRPPASPSSAPASGAGAASSELRVMRPAPGAVADAASPTAQKAAPAADLAVAAAPAPPPPLPNIPPPVLPPAPPGREAAALRAAPSLAMASDEAESHGVSGRVTTAGTGAPVPGAQIVLRGVSRVATSDSGGRFSLGALPPGSYSGSVRSIGYAPAPVEVVVRDPAATTSVDVALRPITLALNEAQATGAAAAEESRRERGTPGAVAAPAAAPQRDAAVVRSATGSAVAPTALAGCYALEVTGGSTGDRRALERTLPRTLALLTAAAEDQPGWLALTSGAVRGALPVAGARWRLAAADSVEVVWSGGETPVQLYLRPQGDALVGTAARRADGADRGSVRVTARRRACPGG